MCLKAVGRTVEPARILMVALIPLMVWAPLHGQTADPAYAALARAYETLRAGDYDAAVASFRAAIEASPSRPGIRKDLAYTYLKIGENELAREQFREAMRLDPADAQVALEYAFLCYETKQQAEARRIFERLRKLGAPYGPTAEQAFQNIDAPLAAGIDRWQKAIAMGAGNFSVYFELATLAEQRDELALAAVNYEKAWRLLPDRRSVLVDLGRVWLALGRTEDATAALLAASRGGEARGAEMAHEFLPDRYPYVAEFRRGLELDPGNAELRRELAYLLLRMNRGAEAEIELRTITELAPGDLLAATQLGFLLYARGDRGGAQPLFDRVLAGNDEDLANRVRAVLRLPQVLRSRATSQPESIDAKVMAERSIRAGYLKDALKYLHVAHEADPGDFDIMLKLGQTFNNLHLDRDALPWFDLARKSSDPQIAGEADQAWGNLRTSSQRFRTYGWLYPMFSTRWNDLFSYGQVRTELQSQTAVRLYASIRFVGDTRRTLGSRSTEFLSESSIIVALGLTTATWHGARAWFEAGNAAGYLQGHLTADYRGGLSLNRRLGTIADSSVDAIYVSRFNKDFLLYDRSRVGRVTGPVQLYWNCNFTVDAKREYWANFAETGPGIRYGLGESSYLTLSLLRGVYLINAGNPRRPNYFDLRAGFWYAFSH
jgi:Flp pilus assembly protein TadD